METGTVKSINKELERQDDIDKLIYDKVFELFEKVVHLEASQEAMKVDSKRTTKQFKITTGVIIVLQVISILIHLLLMR